MAERKRRRMAKPVARLDRETSASAIRGREVRSNFVESGGAALPSNTQPCNASEGTRWIWAYNRAKARPDSGLVSGLLAKGKWLIRVDCAHVEYCWSRVRGATEEGTLGIGAKVSTDWGKAHDPASFGPRRRGGWEAHVICVYTADWHDRDEVARVGRRLGEIDAVRRQTLTYKPDALTYAGVYAGNSPGEVAIYSIRPPYRELHEYSENLKEVVALIDRMQQGAGGS